MKKKPNVLIIFPDQLRRYAAGYWSKPPYREHVIGEPDPVVTPNLDRLASESLVYTSAISNCPVCSPHRGMFLSGMFPEKNGLTTNCRKGNEAALRQDLTTIIDVFANDGYATAYFGKCHWVKTEPHFDAEDCYVGTAEEPGGNYINAFDTYVPPGPDRHGIDYFFQTISDGHCNPRVYSSDPEANDGNPDGTPWRPQELSTKVESRTLLDYLQNTHGQRDPDKPFFAIWSINPPHSSWSDENTETVYRDRYYNEEAYPNRTDLLVRGNLIPDAEQEVVHVRNYFSAVSSVDHYIGQVLDHLREEGMLEDTLVLFTADHGEYLGSHFQSGKNGPHLEAYGVPFILSWPGHIPPGLDQNMIGAPDIFPTVLGLVGMEDRIQDCVQGTNYAPLIRDPETSAVQPAKDALLYLHETNRRGILSKEAVLVVLGNSKATTAEEPLDAYLFDHHEDPYQTRMIPLSERPEVAGPLLELLAAYLQDIEDSWWQEKVRSDLIPW